MTNINKNFFSPQNVPHTAKLCFSVISMNLRAISLKISLFSQKSDYLRNEHRITQKFVFLNNFESRQTKRKFGFV